MPPSHLARCRVPVRRRAILVVPEGERPHPRTSYGCRIGLENATDNFAIGYLVAHSLDAPRMFNFHIPRATGGAARRPGVWVMGRAEAISYFAFLTSPFFTPASGKIHIAATMNTAVAMTKIESSGRIGDPLQNASTAATISATAETAALTSVGTAIALRNQLAPTGTAAASSGRRGAPRIFFFTNRVS